MNKKVEQPAAENPEKLIDLEVTEPKEWAAGIPADGPLARAPHRVSTVRAW